MVHHSMPVNGTSVGEDLRHTGSKLREWHRQQCDGLISRRLEDATSSPATNQCRGRLTVGHGSHNPVFSGFNSHLRYQHVRVAQLARRSGLRHQIMWVRLPPRTPISPCLKSIPPEASWSLLSAHRLQDGPQGEALWKVNRTGFGHAWKACGSCGSADRDRCLPPLWDAYRVQAGLQILPRRVRASCVPPLC